MTNPTLASPQSDRQSTSDSVPPTWELLIAETRTGAVIRELPVVAKSTPTWSRGVNSRGSLTAQVPVYSDMISTAALHELLDEPARYSIAWCAGSWVAQAGPIQRVIPVRADKARDSYLNVEARGLWSLLDDRPIGPAGTTVWTAEAADTVLGPLSWRTVVKKLCEQMETWTDSGLPLVYEADVAGTATATYRGYELARVGERIHDITQLRDGCDVEIRPRLSADRKTLEWLVVTGDPYLGQSGSPHVWVSGSDLLSVTPILDATNQATDHIVTGQGSERGRLIASATNTALTSAGGPRRWAVYAEHGSTTDLAVLAEYAEAYAEAYGAPLSNWSAVVRTYGAGPILSTFEPGDDGLFMVTGEPWLTEGDYRRRIIDIGHGSTRDEIALTLASVPVRF